MKPAVGLLPEQVHQAVQVFEVGPPLAQSVQEIKKEAPRDKKSKQQDAAVKRAATSTASQLRSKLFRKVQRVHEHWEVFSSCIFSGFFGYPQCQSY